MVVDAFTWSGKSFQSFGPHTEKADMGQDSEPIILWPWPSTNRPMKAT